MNELHEAIERETQLAMVLHIFFFFVPLFCHFKTCAQIACSVFFSFSSISPSTTMSTNCKFQNKKRILRNYMKLDKWRNPQIHAKIKAFVLKSTNLFGLVVKWFCVVAHTNRMLLICEYIRARSLAPAMTSTDTYTFNISCRNVDIKIFFMFAILSKL